MEIYQCPDCLGVHDVATEPVLGLFVRCEACFLAASLLGFEPKDDASLAPEQAPPVAA
jgi:hypothetical protein